jgi:hypothetical protein
MLTDERKKRLHAAIDAAQGYSRCQYVTPDKDAPQCVIGQLAALEGVTADQLKEWHGTVNYVIQPFRNLDGVMKRAFETSDRLDAYPTHLLRALQARWDEPRAYDLVAKKQEDEDVGAAKARADMHKIVDDWK